jgi:peptide deformylase
MAHLKLVHFPDPRLRKKCEPIAKIDATIRTLVEDMYETMYAEKGVGLAANQIGISLRVFVMDVSEQQNQKICAINPELISVKDTYTEFEGCLSYEGVFDKVTRGSWVRFKALDIDGNVYEMEGDGLFAKCVQHEIDHLNGKLFVDHLSRLKQDRARKKLEKQRRQAL